MNRHRFHGLADGWARLDAPAGSQPVDTAIDAMAAFMRSGVVANGHGAFEASERLDAFMEDARAVAAEFVGGGDPRGVVFGPSATALTLMFAAAAGRALEPGDEIVCTRLDHDANVRPWLIAAERAGATVRFAEPDPETLDLPVSAVESALTARTRWVAVTAASNAVGTAPDLASIAAAAHAAGARVYVDAVHAAPHRPLEVVTKDCDALVCSAYKWFGPHESILWARPEILEELWPDKLRPSPDEIPWRWETGTPAFEAIAGLVAAARYVMETGYDAIRRHEEELLRMLSQYLADMPGVILHGAPRDRVPTVMFSIEGRDPHYVAAALAADRVAVWHGNYYALELSRFLGLEPDGALRAGIVHYNDVSDIVRLVEAIQAVTRVHAASPARPA